MIAVEMKMPDRCLDCPLNKGMQCVVTGNTTFDDIMRPRWCPLHDFGIALDSSVHVQKA